ncbi:MAG: hypothetical protein AAF360_03940 [Pseudomonadota bacterium]
MVDWMTLEGAATISERPYADWRRLNTIVADQADVEFTDGAIDFRMIELCLSGRRDMRCEGCFEDGDRASATFQSGAMNYAPSKINTSQACEGRAALQQIYIDDSLFRDVAAEIIPGDQDAVGFLSVFDPRLRQIALAILGEARAPSEGGDLYADLLGQQLATLLLRRRLGASAKPGADAKALTAADMARIGARVDRRRKRCANCESEEYRLRDYRHARKAERRHEAFPGVRICSIARPSNAVDLSGLRGANLANICGVRVIKTHLGVGETPVRSERAGPKLQSPTSSMRLRTHARQSVFRPNRIERIGECPRARSAAACLRLKLL